MNLKLTGAVLAVALAMTLVLAPSATSAESADVREAELYAGSAFAYSPSGEWADAKASGSALDAGLEWADGTLSGAISAPGTYCAAIESADRSLEISFTVLPAPDTGSDDDGSDGTSYAKPEGPAVSGLKVSGDGRSIVVSASVTDAQKLTYNWGDGTRSVVSVESVLQGAQHSYRQGGTYSVVITAEGPYATAYATAMYDAPADQPSNDDGKLQLLFTIILLLVNLAIFAAFIITWDFRLFYAAVIMAVIDVIALLYVAGAFP